MSMLTFLRIGKEIHDETEDYLLNHLIDRDLSFVKRIKRRLLNSLNQFITLILKLFHFDKLI